MPPASQQVLLLDLHDGVLQNIVSRLGLDRRTVMLVCRRLRDMAAGAVHSHQRPGMSVQDAIEAAEAGDTLHLLPGFYKEALLLKKPLHLICDVGTTRILSPARFAVMVNASGCLLENMVLKSHQIDESVFYLVEYGPLCSYIRMRHCEVLQGSFVGIQDLKGPNTYLGLEHCLLHVGLSLMAGRLDMTDCTVKCTGDSMYAYPNSTLVMRRCRFIDINDPITIESRTALVEGCQVWAYDRGPFCLRDSNMPPDEVEAEINQRLLYLEEEPPENVWVVPARWPEAGVRAVGRRASEAQRALVEQGKLIPERVVMWGNTSFESRSQQGITAQQEEVRREARALMAEMQRGADEENGLEPDSEFSIGNSVEDPESDDSLDDGQGDEDWESDSDSDLDADLGPAFIHPPGDDGQIIDLLSSDDDGDDDLIGSDDSTSTSSSSDEEGDGHGGGGGGGGREAGSVPGGSRRPLPVELELPFDVASTSSSSSSSSEDEEEVEVDVTRAGRRRRGRRPGLGPCLGPLAGSGGGGASSGSPAVPGAVSDDAGTSSSSDGSDAE